MYPLLSLFCCLFSVVAFAQRPVALVVAGSAHLPRTEWSAPTSHRETRVRLAAGLVVLRAELDGRSGNFLLDTGAPGLVLNGSPDGTEYVGGLMGDATAETVAVGHFRWQGIERTDLTALRVDLSRIERALDLPLQGLVGYELLQQQVVDLQLADGRLVLNPRERPRRRGLAMCTRAHLPIVRVRIDGRTYRFGIDSGASVNVLADQVYRELDPTTYEARAARYLCGVGAERQRTPVILLDQLKIGKQQAAKLALSVASLAHFEADYGVRLDGILGQPWLQQHRVVLDYPRGRLYVE